LTKWLNCAMGPLGQCRVPMLKRRTWARVVRNAYCTSSTSSSYSSTGSSQGGSSNLGNSSSQQRLNSTATGTIPVAKRDEDMPSMGRYHSRTAQFGGDHHLQMRGLQQDLQKMYESKGSCILARVAAGNHPLLEPRAATWW
jgi:hypothetical protein